MTHCGSCVGKSFEHRREQLLHCILKKKKSDGDNFPILVWPTLELSRAGGQTQAACCSQHYWLYTERDIWRQNGANRHLMSYQKVNAIQLKNMTTLTRGLYNQASSTYPKYLSVVCLNSHSWTRSAWVVTVRAVINSISQPRISWWIYECVHIREILVSSVSNMTSLKATKTNTKKLNLNNPGS